MELMERAYFLGHLASFACVHNENEYMFTLPWTRNDEIERLLYIGFDHATFNKKNVALTVDVEKVQHKIDTLPTSYEWVFIRGIYDGCGILFPDSEEMVSFSVREPEMAKKIDEFLKGANVIYTISLDGLGNTFFTFTGTDALDFLAKIYNDSHEFLRSAYMFDQYHTWVVTCTKLPVLAVYKTHPDAITPSKTRESDVGYDITIVCEHKKLNDITSLYDTGIKVKVPRGFYVEVVPRSSLSKSGYIMANSVGIIDRSYTGTIYIALTKVDPNALPIEFPFKCAQMILRNQNHATITESTCDFAETSRGAGGFGSTNQK